MTQDHAMLSAQLLQEVERLRERVVLLEQAAADQGRVEQVLQERERRFRALLEHCSDAIKVIAPDGTILDDMPSTSHILGYGDVDFRGQNVFDFLHPNDVALVGNLIAELFRRPRQTLTGQFRARHRDGSWRWLEAVATNLLDEPAVGGLVINYRDVTERYEAAEAMRASEQRLTEILETVADGIVVIAREGRITFANAAAARLLGQPRDQILRYTIESWSPRLTRADGEPLSAGDLVLQRVLQTGEAITGVERRVTRPDGSWVIVSSNVAPLRDAAGTVTGAVLSFTDISERKRMEEQLRQALKLEAVGRLAGGIAHDFNNLLTIIQGYAELLMERLPSEGIPGEGAREIRTAAGRAATLVQQLLAFSRKQFFMPQVLDLNALLRHLHSMLSNLLGPSSTLNADLAPDLWPIRADPSQIEQVLVNLFLNAREAMPRGGQVTVSTANQQTPAHCVSCGPLPPDEYVCLAVRDTGRGMDEQTRVRIFEPFFTTKEVGQGPGLGLASVYGIVKQSGGHVDVVSAPGKGTTLLVYLPRGRE